MDFFENNFFNFNFAQKEHHTRCTLRGIQEISFLKRLSHEIDLRVLRGKFICTWNKTSWIRGSIFLRCMKSLIPNVSRNQVSFNKGKYYILNLYSEHPSLKKKKFTPKARNTRSRIHLTIADCSATATTSYPASLSNLPNGCQGHPRLCLSAGPPVDYRTGSKLCSDAQHFLFNYWHGWHKMHKAVEAWKQKRSV
jgi:hypothetical protein